MKEKGDTGAGVQVRSAGTRKFDKFKNMGIRVWGTHHNFKYLKIIYMLLHMTYINNNTKFVMQFKSNSQIQ